MKIFPNTSKRSYQPELMDDQGLQEKELENILDDLDKVNRLLGGFKITEEGVQKVLGSSCFAQPVRILDVGCGNGSMLKHIARMGRSKGIKMELIGIDINEKSLSIARRNAVEYPEISFNNIDVTSEELKEIGKVDLVICTLTLHHFRDEEIVLLLRIFSEVSTMGVVINDLHRSRWAYFLFLIFSSLFLKHPISKKDGLTSIQRAFSKKELEKFSQDLQVRKQIISWKWAFRYQWIILK